MLLNEPYEFPVHCSFLIGYYATKLQEIEKDNVILTCLLSGIMLFLVHFSFSTHQAKGLGVAYRIGRCLLSLALWVCQIFYFYFFL